jgi:hypothetical protein
MSKFDLIYERTIRALREEREYVNSDFADNIRLLVKALKDNDFINPDRNVEAVVQKVLSQPHNVKELPLDTQENSMPPVKVKITPESESEGFSVQVIDLNNPEKPKTFSDSMMETIFKDVISAIKAIVLQGIQPEAAVDELPPAEGGNAQPGAEGSALPQGEPQKQPAPAV